MYDIAFFKRYGEIQRISKSQRKWSVNVFIKKFSLISLQKDNGWENIHPWLQTVAQIPYKNIVENTPCGVISKYV